MAKVKPPIKRQPKKDSGWPSDYFEAKSWTEEELIKYISKACPYLAQCIGIDADWLITWSLSHTAEMDDKKALAETSWTSHYKGCSIRFHIEKLSTQLSPFYLDAIICHELYHPFFAPIYAAYEDHVGEGTISGLAIDAALEEVVDRASIVFLRWVNQVRFGPFNL